MLQHPFARRESLVKSRTCARPWRNTDDGCLVPAAVAAAVVIVVVIGVVIVVVGNEPTTLLHLRVLSS